MGFGQKGVWEGYQTYIRINFEAIKDRRWPRIMDVGLKVVLIMGR